MSDSVQSHRRQPTRLSRPWDSPGKNTGVCCRFLLQSTKVKSESEVSQSCPTPSNPVDCSLPGSSIHGTFPARVWYMPNYRPQTPLKCLLNVFCCHHFIYREWFFQVIIILEQGAPGGSVVKNLLADAGDIRDVDSIPGSGRSPRGGNSIPLSILAWRIPWTEEPGRLLSMESPRVGHDWSDLAHIHYLEQAVMSKKNNSG